ncbi:MAG: flagellar hook-length control protein FliK [Treponema sp.]|jgi:hypothetical protein|nr:flagellar hook-length control protein FliK [Treponema sp.]
MMQVSLQMHSSDGSLEGISGIDKGGEPSSLSSTQGQEKSRKQGKLDVFARLLDGLGEPSRTDPSLKAMGKLQGQHAAEAFAGEALKGNSPKQQKKVSLAAGAREEAGKAGSGKRGADLLQSGKDKTAGEGSFACLAVQEGPAPKQLSLQEGLLPKDRKGSLRPQATKTHRSPGAGSRTASATEQVPGQNEGTAQEVALNRGLSKVKADNRDIQGSTGDEKAAFRKPSPLKLSQSAGAVEQLGLSLASRQGVGTAEEPVRKGLKADTDAKTRDKRRDRLDLRDLRSRGGVESASGVLAAGDSKSGGESKTVELFVDLHTDARDREAVPASREKALTRNFEDLLSRELSRNLSTDIVRQAQVFLRNSGEGTIRLALRPESLGNVKIQLELAEKKIIGHIIVESNEALRAFEREIHSLEQAFKDSGFGETSLDTALASEGDGKGGNPQQREGEGGPFFSERFAASTYDVGTERTGDAGMRMLLTGTGVSSEHMPINMLV